MGLHSTMQFKAFLTYYLLLYYAPYLSFMLATGIVFVAEMQMLTDSVVGLYVVKMLFRY